LRKQERSARSPSEPRRPEDAPESPRRGRAWVLVVVLLVILGALYAAIPAVPFLPLTTAQKISLATGLAIAGGRFSGGLHSSCLDGRWSAVTAVSLTPAAGLAK